MLQPFPKFGQSHIHITAQEIKDYYINVYVNVDTIIDQDFAAIIGDSEDR